MMKVVHTSDVHLRRVGDERWKAFEGILDMADDVGASLVVVSGDLFDVPSLVGTMKVEIRSLFRGRRFRTVVLPGNHDREGFLPGDYLGDGVHVITRVGEFVDVEGVRILGIPYETLDATGVLDRLEEASYFAGDGKVNILLVHGELLDDLFPAWGYGDEGSQGMGFRLSYFEGRPFKYVLAGHYHTRFDVKGFGDGGFFVYPGSPISITSREVGPRAVNVFEVGSPPCEVRLETPYFHEVSIFLNPFSSEDPVDVVRKELSSIPSFAKIVVRVGGYMDGSRMGLGEYEVVNGIMDVLKKDGRVLVDRVEISLRDVGSLVGGGLFPRLVEKLKARLVGSGFNEDEAMKMVIEAFIKADIR